MHILLARLSVQAIAIVVSGSLVGLALNATSPHPTRLGIPVHPASPAGAMATCSQPEATDPSTPRRLMSLRDALAACAACSAAFIDARSRAAFEQGHVAGAVHLPPDNDADLRQALERLRAFETIVVYDDDDACQLAGGVANLLLREGFADVRLLDGTWTNWQAAQGPSQAGACDACATHEVQP